MIPRPPHGVETPGRGGRHPAGPQGQVLRPLSRAPHRPETPRHPRADGPIDYCPQSSMHRLSKNGRIGTAVFFGTMTIGAESLKWPTPSRNRKAKDPRVSNETGRNRWMRFPPSVSNRLTPHLPSPSPRYAAYTCGIVYDASDLPIASRRGLLLSLCHVAERDVCGSEVLTFSHRAPIPIFFPRTVDRI